MRPADLGSRLPLVGAVVPLEQIGVDDSARAETGELAGAPGTRERTSKHSLEVNASKALAETAGISFALRGQRQVGPPRVLTRKAPGRLAMSYEIRSR